MWESGRQRSQRVKRLAIVQGVEVRVERGLGGDIRAERDRLAQLGQGVIAAPAASVNRGRQVQRQILLWLFGEDRINETLCTGLVAIVEGSRGRRQSLLRRRRLRRSPAKLPFAQVEIDASPLEQGALSGKSREERVECLGRDGGTGAAGEPPCPPQNTEPLQPPEARRAEKSEPVQRLEQRSLADLTVAPKKLTPGQAGERVGLFAGGSHSR